MKPHKKLSDVKTLNELKILLRARQWQKALSGNVAMLKFLGINYLNQTDKTDLVIRDVKQLDTLIVVEGDEETPPDAIVIQ